MNNNNTIFSSFIKDKHVASIAPTSKRNVNSICKKIDFNKDIVVVEYGPGNGVFTECLLSMMNGDSRLIAVERNKRLAAGISGVNDRRLKVFNDSAQNIKAILKQEECGGVDYVVSGIPLAFLKHQERERLIIDTYDTLKPGGSFFVYQFTTISRELLKKHFDAVSTRFLPINIPPLFLLQAVKKPAT